MTALRLHIDNNYYVSLHQSEDKKGTLAIFPENRFLQEPKHICYYSIDDNTLKTFYNDDIVLKECPKFCGIMKKYMVRPVILSDIIAKTKTRRIDLSLIFCLNVKGEIEEKSKILNYICSEEMTDEEKNKEQEIINKLTVLSQNITVEDFNEDGIFISKIFKKGGLL